MMIKKTYLKQTVEELYEEYPNDYKIYRVFIKAGRLDLLTNYMNNCSGDLYSKISFLDNLSSIIQDATNKESFIKTLLKSNNILLFVDLYWRKYPDNTIEKIKNLKLGEFVNQLVGKYVQYLKGKDTSYIAVSKFGNLTTIQNSCNMQDSNEALKWAVVYDNIEIVEFFLDQGLNIHLDNDYLVLAAAEYSCRRTLSCLISRGSNIHINADEPLILASENGDLATVKTLIKAGANPYAQDCKAFLWSLRSGNIHVVKDYIEEYGVDINVCDGRAIRSAVTRGDTDRDIIRLLLSYNIDISAKHYQALRAAARNPKKQMSKKQTDVLDLLFEYCKEKQKDSIIYALYQSGLLQPIIEK